jgi:hypothetical protein
MIEMIKTYRTRYGYPVRIYATDGGGEYPIHGAFFSDGKWHNFAWSIKGESYIGCPRELDLIEVKPRIQREVWVNLYDDMRWTGCHRTRKEADISASSQRIACVHLTIDCEHGEGL